MWEIDINDQAITFLLSLCLGCVQCAIYDVLRAIRKIAINSFFAVLLTDVFLWIIYAFITFVFLISRTNGEIRGYVLIGELTGFCVFRVSLSKLLFPALVFVVKFSVKVKRCIHKFFYLVIARIEEFAICIFKSAFKILKSALKTVKKLLKNIIELLYTNKNIASMENDFDETQIDA